MSRKGQHQSIAVDAHKLIGEVADLLSRTLDKRIQVTHELQADPPLALGDPNQLQQVILNLAVNARDAMPQGGQLRFATAVRAVGFDGAPARDGLVPGRYLQLSVEDTGTGIPAEIRDRIFEPFFTTKKPGEGTGLGLAVVYGIVKNHGGLIDVDSEVGRGTRFQVLLPVASVPASEAAAPKATPGPAKGRILVVEDEEVVRTTVQFLLQKAGYQVELAEDGPRGIAAFRARRDEVDLVLLDFNMPGADGGACLEQMQAIKPGVKVLLSTGYGLGGAHQHLLDDPSVSLLQKPYALSQLTEAVRRALG
jgi:CheY-like chemotaxis protein